MIQYAVSQWDKNKEILKRHIEYSVKNSTEDWIEEYKDVVKMTIKYILNPNSEYRWNAEEIAEIDDGDYQGTLLYLIPEDTYQPDVDDYLMTYVHYGSCSGCDTLGSIKYDNTTDEEKIEEYMQLCLHLIQNIIKPYNTGWRYKKEFDIISQED